MDTLINEFCQTVRERSIEHQKAVSILLENGIIGVAITVLRQEIDSLIRVSYLYSLGANSVESERLIANFVSGKQWDRATPNGKMQKITDKDMVDLEKGWVEVVYKFGCKLIHLSEYHSYNRNDPFLKLDSESKTKIINYLKDYHQYPYETISKEQFTSYISKILKKIVDNTDYYLKEIENNVSK
ncbi:MAG: hypothetical protein EA343_13305 [Nodularia sp. (in: Bacteria)]|nr:MAG: hypothetical protein EA343_13305 [Nodularia sp. (in: cyanobacteria)]